MKLIFRSAESIVYVLIRVLSSRVAGNEHLRDVIVDRFV